MSQGMNDLLKWSIENSANASNGQPTNDTTGTSDDAPATVQQNPSTQLNPEALAALLGGPSDADLMREAIAVLLSPNPTLENKLIAFDNFEQLIENLDNANNMTVLGLWPGLLSLLDDPHPQIRMYAAWCVGTAVQNNVKAQEQLSSLNIPIEQSTTETPQQMSVLAKLVDMALSPPQTNGTTNDNHADSSSATDTQEQENKVQRKAVYAISSQVRNYQPAMDQLIPIVRARGYRGSGHDAPSNGSTTASTAGSALGPATSTASAPSTTTTTAVTAVTAITTPHDGGSGTSGVDASDMDAVDKVIAWLKGGGK